MERRDDGRCLSEVPWSKRRINVHTDCTAKYRQQWPIEGARLQQVSVTLDSFKKKLTKASKKHFKDNATGGDIRLRVVSHKEHSGVQTPRTSLCNMHMLLNIKSKTLVGHWQLSNRAGEASKRAG